MNSRAANSSGSAESASPSPPLSLFIVLPDGSCTPATPENCRLLMKRARGEARKQARLKREEKASELQMNLEDRAAVRRLTRELAEIDRGGVRWAGRFTVGARPETPSTRTSPVRKRRTIAPINGPQPHRDGGRAASSWVVDDRGMRGIMWQQSYLGRKSPSFYRGAARDHWDYVVRDEAVLLSAAGEPVILTNMGDDWVEVGAAWQAMEDASTRKNAKIQIRATAPFDSDASEEEMIAALRHFCETILKPLDLPYSAAIHRSPEGGDERNVHPHILFSLRPMRRLAPYVWEVADEVRGELDGKNGVQMLRHLWAHSMSEAAEQARRNMRYTGLGYGARGLDLEAGEHLGEARAAMVARGVRVWAHERNRIKSARNAARLVIRDADRKIAALTTVRDRALAAVNAGPSASRARLIASARPVIGERLQPSSAVHRVRDRLNFAAGRNLTPAARSPRHDGNRRLVLSQGTNGSDAVAADAKRTLVVSSPPRPTPRLHASSPASARRPRLTPASPPAPFQRLVAATSVRPESGQRNAPDLGTSAGDALRAVGPSSRTGTTSAPASSPDDAGFRLKIDALLLALATARAKRDMEREAAKRRREIPPFDGDGLPTIALRDVLLKVSRAPVVLESVAGGGIEASGALEPVRDLLDIWRDDAGVMPLVEEVVARKGETGRGRWPPAVADLMEDHDRLRGGGISTTPAGQGAAAVDRPDHGEDRATTAPAATAPAARITTIRSDEALREEAMRAARARDKAARTQRDMEEKRAARIAAILEAGPRKSTRPIDEEERRRMLRAIEPGPRRAAAGVHPRIDVWLQALNKDVPVEQRQRIATQVMSEGAARDALDDIDRNVARRIREDAQDDAERRRAWPGLDHNSENAPEL